MRIYTAHLREDATPVLLREGFSLWAFVFGPFWLLANRAWIPGILFLCADVVVAGTPRPFGAIFGLAVAWMIGLTGRDLLRWSLRLRGYAFAHIVAASNDDTAWVRLLTLRPDLIDLVRP